MDDNTVYLAGVLASPPIFSHESHGQGYYGMMIGSMRLSGVTDTLRVQIPARTLDGLELTAGGPVAVRGRMRSYNNKSGTGSRLVLSVLAREVMSCHDGHNNLLTLTGTLCKPPVYRRTPLGREICDLLLAVSRYQGRSDYLPCIAWGTAARAASGFRTGERVALRGRLQSRVYVKQENGAEMEKTAYEISASEIRLLEHTHQDLRA
ncbi:MAG: single-stranded DNA-binding protein [Oscillospiraceae bacterium]|nr:single-stranded DNA-binding protein [Oscillospiraceae bacterium]